MSEASRPPERGIVCTEFKRVRKNALFGFATLTIPKWDLSWHDCPVLESHGRRWVGLPGAAMLDREKRAMTDEKGKIRYAATAAWLSRESRDRFSDAAVAAILLVAPDAFDDDEGNGS